MTVAKTRPEKIGLLLYLRDNRDLPYHWQFTKETSSSERERVTKQYYRDFLQMALDICQELPLDCEWWDELKHSIMVLLQAMCDSSIGSDEKQRVRHSEIDDPDLWLHVLAFLARTDLWQEIEDRNEDLSEAVRSTLLAFAEEPPRCFHDQTFRVDEMESCLPEAWYEAVIRSGSSELFLEKDIYHDHHDARWGIAKYKLAEDLREELKNPGSRFCRNAKSTATNTLAELLSESSPSGQFVAMMIGLVIPETEVSSADAFSDEDAP